MPYGDADYRLWESVDCKTGYPSAWEHIKHEVREDAGHRCVRCLHPYEGGSGEWSFCDEHCEHHGPVRILSVEGDIEHEHDGNEPDPTMPWPAGYRVQARWRILTVHHLDGNKANCRWFNLAALCQRCHLTIQGKVQMERVWPWEHSDWFKPYVAGYYAHVYRGEDLDRATVEARLDDLLSLERAA